MKINFSQEITAKKLMEDIKFHGETNGDEKSLEKLKELGELLKSTINEINLFQSLLNSHISLASAKEMFLEIDSIKNDIAEIMAEYGY